MECERLGYDSVWVYDHLSPFWITSGYTLECWTLLSAIAARTKQIRIGSLVTNVNLRNPALLAKMTSTLDNISKGRLILGLGIGDKLSRNELHSYGYRFAPLSERIDRLRETIQILKALWTQEETSFNGKHFQISRARNYPKPVQNPHPQIWIGGKHHMLQDVIAETADGWNYWGLKRSDLIEREDYLQSKCIERNREFGNIVRSWTGTAPIDSKAKTQAELVDRVREGLLAQTDGRTDYFIASFPEEADSRVFQTFADAVSSIV